MAEPIAIISADTLSKLVTLGVASLGAYVSLVSFAPRVFDEYRKLCMEAQKSPTERVKFNKRFETTVQRFHKLKSALPLMYGLCGGSTTILAANLAYSGVPCGLATCWLLWLPYLCTFFVVLSLAYLATLAFSLLELFNLSVSDTLELPK